MDDKKTLPGITSHFRESDLPVGFSNLSRLTVLESISVVKSRFYQTESLVTRKFYKPISKMIIPARPDDKL